MPYRLAMLSPAAPFWDRLPSEVQRLLLLGSVGKLHIVGLAEKALSHAAHAPPGQAAFLVKLGLDLLLAAWEDDPLDGHLAAQLAALQAKLPGVPKRLNALLHLVVRAWGPPSQNAYYSRLLQRRDADRLRRYLEQMVGKEPENLYWWQQVLACGGHVQDWEWVQRCLDQYWTGALPAVRAVIQCDLDRARGLPLRKRDERLRRTQTMTRAANEKFLGDLALTRGEDDKALTHWMASLRLRPWQTTLLLRAYDLLTMRDRHTAALPGRTTILLYSYNKADDLAVTLTSLAASELNGAKIIVLDNASTDHTPTLLRSWAERRGPDRLEIVSLPVNIGAPAARNWLMHLPECRESDWLVYLDDDVSLPTDWLLRLGAAVDAYPQAGVWGCKVVDFQNPMKVQSADLHVLPLDQQEQPGPRADWLSYKLSDVHYQVSDHQQLSYLRPCASVTGCCHLFAKDVLLDCGDFDLRFSPSQFDDVDHDLRLALKGYTAVYQGHLTVGHMRQTGEATTTDASQYGNAMANEYKLHKKYAPDMVDHISAHEQEVMRQDLHAKVRTISRMFDYQGWVDSHG